MPEGSKFNVTQFLCSLRITERLQKIRSRFGSTWNGGFQNLPWWVKYLAFAGLLILVFLAGYLASDSAGAARRASRAVTQIHPELYRASQDLATLETQLQGAMSKLPTARRLTSAEQALKDTATNVQASFIQLKAKVDNWYAKVNEATQALNFARTAWWESSLVLGLMVMFAIVVIALAVSWAIVISSIRLSQARKALSEAVIALNKTMGKAMPDSAVASVLQEARVAIVPYLVSMNCPMPTWLAAGESRTPADALAEAVQNKALVRQTLETLQAVLAQVAQYQASLATSVQQAQLVAEVVGAFVTALTGLLASPAPETSSE